NDRFVLVEGPLHLLLQCRIVLDDKQGFARFVHAGRPSGAAGAEMVSARGSKTRTCVPTLGVLSISISPPRPDRYCQLSYTPMPMPAAFAVWHGLNSR